MDRSSLRTPVFVSRLLMLAVLPCLPYSAACVFAQDPASSANPDAMQLIQNGATAMHDGRSVDAERYFSHATRIAPELPEAYFGLGMAELRLGKSPDAESALNKALELNPAMQGAHLFLGIAEFQMNKPEASVASLKLELEHQPDNVEVLTWLGIAELGAGHADQAVGPLDRAAALNPKDPNVLDYRGRAHSLVSQQSYRALTALDPDSWRVHRALGEVASESNDWQNAATEYQKAIDRQPNNADLYEALGDTLQHLHRLPEAKTPYETELKLSPHNPVALYNLGRMEVERGDPARGVSLLREAAAASAPSAAISVYLGRGLTDTGHPDEAVTWLEKSLTESPSDWMKQTAWFELARAYKMLGRGDDAKHAADELKKLKAVSGDANNAAEATK